jgi:transposase
MKFVGIDLHKRFLVVAVEDENGPVGKPKRLRCCDEDAIVEHFRALGPFRAVIEASCSYRWLYDLLSPMGSVVLAHPYHLRAIVAARAKTDKLDAALLAKLLRAGLIPEAYIPPEPIQHLRDLTRGRARLTWSATQAKNQVQTLLRARNIHPSVKTLFSKAGRRWLGELDLGPAGNVARDELLRRLEHFDREIHALDDELERLADAFPEMEALTALHGIAEFSALLIVAEIGEPHRFASAQQVGAYAGLTARVHQSGAHCYHGHISKQGSRWLRWILVQAAMKIVRKDHKLNNFYTRIRKRSGRNVARVAVARKLAGICWLRLRRWHREHISASR